MTQLKDLPPSDAGSLERQAGLLRAANRTAKAVATILDPDELLRATLDILCNEFRTLFVGVFLIDETRQWAHLRLARGEAGAGMIAGGYKLAVGGNTLIGLVTRLREARVALDMDTEIDYVRSQHLPSARSEMALPMLAGDELIGALAVYSADPAAFSREDADTLQSIADQIAIAVKNSRLHRQNEVLLRRAERRARLSQAANEVGKQVASILDLDTLLTRMVDIICDAYGFYYAGIFLLDESGEWAELRAGYGDAGAAMLAKGHRLKVGGHSMIGMATSLREARIALDVGEERVHFKNPLLPHTRSEMALPLAVGDQVLGAVTVQSIEERAFSDEDILSLQTMADHLAVAIHNAQLVKALEQAHAALLATRTYEALATATTQAVHWIGNKALPITLAVERMKTDILSGKVDAESLHDDLELIDESVRLILDVKENLLGPAREHKPRPTLLADLAHVAAYQAGVPRERLVIHAAAGTPLAVSDTTQLARALANLFRNSLEANATQIEVSIAPALQPGFVALDLSDDGEGIPPAMLDKIWAAFVTTRGPGHAGLGLPACLHVISQLQGQIVAESQPGQGATFHILLPAAEAGAEAALDTAAGTVLLIDDDDAWAQFVIQALGAAGKAVERYASPEGVPLEQAGVILVDEVLMDAFLPDVLQTLQAAGAAGKAVVVSAATSPERAASYMKAGVKDVALKPYTVAELAAILAG